jgi:hypothetical protein
LEVDESLSSCPCQVCHSLVNPVDEDSDSDGVLGGLSIEEWNISDVGVDLITDVIHLDAVFKVVRSLKSRNLEISTLCEFERVEAVADVDDVVGER